MVIAKSSTPAKVRQTRLTVDLVDFETMKITDRMQYLLELRGVPPRNVKSLLSKVTGCSKQAVYSWFSGDTGQIKSEHIVAIAKEWNSSTDWLLTGLGPIDSNRWPHGKKSSSSQSATSELVTIYQHESPETPEDIERLSHPHRQVLQQWTVKRRALDRLGIQYEKAESLVIISHAGDAMSPTIGNGDSLLIDTAVNTWQNDGIYLFSVDGNIYLRQVHKQPGAGLEARAINARYPSFVLTPELIASFVVHARILLIWRPERL